MNKYTNLFLENQLCFALYQATNTITKLYRSKLTALDLTYSQYLVLVVLHETEGVPIKTISDRLGLDSGTLTPLIKRLEKKSLIRKQRSLNDERVVELYLTNKAQKIMPKLAKIQHTVAQETQLSPKEFTELQQALQNLSTILKAA